jgi:hypothetical protein
MINFDHNNFPFRIDGDTSYQFPNDTELRPKSVIILKMTHYIPSLNNKYHIIYTNKKLTTTNNYDVRL